MLRNLEHLGSYISGVYPCCMIHVLHVHACWCCLASEQCIHSCGSHCIATSHVQVIKVPGINKIEDAKMERLEASHARRLLKLANQAPGDALNIQVEFCDCALQRSCLATAKRWQQGNGQDGFVLGNGLIQIYLQWVQVQQLRFVGATGIFVDFMDQ